MAKSITETLNGKATGGVNRLPVEVVTGTEPAEKSDPVTLTKERLAARREAAKATYRQIVVDLALEREIGDVDLEQVLFLTGKDFDALDADIAKVRTRHDAAQLREEAERTRAEAAALEEERARVRATAEELSRQFREQIEPLVQREQELTKQVERLHGRANDTLERTITTLFQTADPAIDEKLAAIQKEHSNCLQRLTFIVENYGDKLWSADEEQRLKELECSIAEKKVNSTDRLDAIEKLRRWKARKEHVAEIPSLKARMAELEQQQSEVGLKKLEWSCFAL